MAVNVIILCYCQRSHAVTASAVTTVISHHLHLNKLERCGKVHLFETCVLNTFSSSLSLWFF